MEAPPSLMQRRHEVWGAGDRALLKVPQQLQLSWLLHGLVQRSEINPLLPMPPWLCGEVAGRRVHGVRLLVNSFGKRNRFELLDSLNVTRSLRAGRGM